MFAALIFLAGLCSPSWGGEKMEGRATVIDGDTIAIDGFEARIRLYGIDAPEKVQTCDDADGKRYLCGPRSAEYLADLIGRNGRVECFEEARDRYGRIVAECATAKNVVINAAMVKAGWAVVYRQYSDGRYDQEETEAKAAHAGMWQGQFVMPWDWRRGQRAASDHTASDEVSSAPPVILAASGGTCKSVRSCEEAVKLWCGGYSRADRDGDGIPCENVCRSKSQVDAIRKKIGC